MPQISSKDVEKTNRRQDRPGEFDLLFNISEQDVRITAQAFGTEFVDISAVEIFIDSDQLHIVPFRVRMQRRDLA